MEVLARRMLRVKGNMVIIGSRYERCKHVFIINWSMVIDYFINDVHKIEFGCRVKLILTSLN